MRQIIEELSKGIGKGNYKDLKDKKGIKRLKFWASSGGYKDFGLWKEERIVNWIQKEWISNLNLKIYLSNAYIKKRWG